MRRCNSEAVKERARLLYTVSSQFNGLELVLVEIDDGRAFLDVYFYNLNGFEQMTGPEIEEDPGSLFTISGGTRIRGGSGAGQVQVIGMPESGFTDRPVLRLMVEPIGDYSTYTLHVEQGIEGIRFDPLFADIDFKFRPGCFRNDCVPVPGFKQREEMPVIDYLAKDFLSFKHTMITGMGRRVPGWKPTSEADLDQVLLELFSGAADELSDYQDRVMNEAFLKTCRKRVSLARHARLMDYHIHQGNQADTWLALRVETAAGSTGVTDDGFYVPRPADTDTGRPIPLAVTDARKDDGVEPVIFMSRERYYLHPLLNDLALFTWSRAYTELPVGATGADLQPVGTDGSPVNSEVAVDHLVDCFVSGTIPRLLIQEWLNPATGRQSGRDPLKRQIVRLLDGDGAAVKGYDPVSDNWYVRINWREQDSLLHHYVFENDCPDNPRSDISLFHGNLVQVYHGTPAACIFSLREYKEEESASEREPSGEGATPDYSFPLPLAAGITEIIRKPFIYTKPDQEETTAQGWALCKLPDGPLLYRNTEPGGVEPPRSTLQVEVVLPGDPGQRDDWDEVISLIHSTDTREGGDHYMVETDEQGKSVLRFGNGVNGLMLPSQAEVHCFYQIGTGDEGNIGADILVAPDNQNYPRILSCWNPFDVTSGRLPEPRDEIIRRVPEAFRARQLRSVTLADYVRRAEELEQVSKASARYCWTGSWRTVQVAVDPKGAFELEDELRESITAHLDAVRLIGEDLEVRGPRLVPVEILISVCLHPDYWEEDIRGLLDMEFSTGHLPDGRRGFFHPDRWTFGQHLYFSEITARALSIAGIDHVRTLEVRRWNETVTAGIEEDKLLVRNNEIILMRNDPSHLEQGYMTIDFRGGRT